MQMNCGDQTYPFSLPSPVMRMFLISSTALFCLETNNWYIYADWVMVSNASFTNSARRARKNTIAVQGELISFRTERFEAAAGRKRHRIDVMGTRNYIPMPPQFEYYLYVNY
jgi:hypothetical protein